MGRDDRGQSQRRRAHSIREKERAARRRERACARVLRAPRGERARGLLPRQLGAGRRLGEGGRGPGALEAAPRPRTRRRRRGGWERAEEWARGGREWGGGRAEKRQTRGQCVSFELVVS